LTVLTIPASSYYTAGAHWVNPANMYAEDGVFAENNLDRYDNDATTLCFYQFDASAIPYGSALNSLNVFLKYKASLSSPTIAPSLRTRAGVTLIENKGMPATTTTLTTRQWTEVTSTIAQITNAGYNIQVGAYYGAAGANIVYFDALWLVVDYTPPAAVGGFLSLRKGLW